MATIDASIPLQGKSTPLDSPLNSFVQALQAKDMLNKQQLFPIQLQTAQLGYTKAAQQNAILQQLFGGQAPSATAGTTDLSAQPSSGTLPTSLSNDQFANSQSAPAPTAPNALVSAAGSAPQAPASAPASNGMQLNIPLLQRLAATGYDTKNLTDLYKYQNDGVKRDAGAYYQNPTTGETKYYAAPKDGITIDPVTNTVSALPGAANALSTIAGAQSAATEGAKPLPLGYVGKDGRPIGGTVGEYLGNGQQGAPAAPASAPDPSAAPNSQSPQQSGYSAPTVGTDGAALPPQLTSFLGNLQASRDPAKLDSVVQQMTQQVSTMPDGPQKQTALANIQDEANKIKQSWMTPANTLGARPQLQSAPEAAQQAADIRQKNEPNLTYSTDAAKNLATKGEQIGSQLTESQNILQRLDQMRSTLTKFKAGGGTEFGVQLATMAQAIPGMPQSVIDALAHGDLAAAQEFQKYATQASIGLMREALSSDTGQGAQGNRISMEAFLKNSPRLDTDPNAIEKVFNFQTSIHNQLLNKSNMFRQFVSDPTQPKDPAVFDNIYANSQVDKGNVTPKTSTGNALGTKAPAPSASQPQAQTRVVNIGGQQMNAMQAPDGKFYVKQPNGKYAVVNN